GTSAKISFASTRVDAFGPGMNNFSSTMLKTRYSQCLRSCQNAFRRPVEINRAEKRDLLRVPGVGLKGAEAILQARRSGKLRDIASLRKLGIIVARAAPFLLLDGRRPVSQLSMF